MRIRGITLFALLLLSLMTTTAYATRSRAARRNVPTFNKEVVRIFQQNCQSCHHPGDIAPFSLMTWSDAWPVAENIKFMTQTRKMPPWKPTAGCRELQDERRLSQTDIDIIAGWVDAGAPEGRKEDLPEPLEFDSGWMLGRPDLTLMNPEAYTPPTDRDMYRCFTLPANNANGEFVSAIDVHPGNRKIVHHVLAYVDTTGESQALDERDPGPGYTSFGGPGFTPGGMLGGWVPGSRPAFLPDGIAMQLPANSRIVLQVHYHPNQGQVGPDQTEIGIYYSKSRPAKILRVLPLINDTFLLPAGAADTEVRASFTIPPFVNAHAIQVAPHMHLLGRTIKVEVTPLGGSKQCMINIDDWDFNWQGFYQFRNPVPLPASSTITLTAHYDNSAANPRNPNIPPKDVMWGEETTDEMALAFVGFTLDAENLAKMGGDELDLSWIPAMP